MTMTSDRSTFAEVGELQSAVDLLHDGLAITDKDGVFVYMNPSHATLFDYAAPSDLLGKPWSTLYRPEIADWFGRFVMPRLFSNGAWRGEAEGLSATGRPVPQEVSLTVSATGGIICVTRDISSRKRDEALLGRLRDWLVDASLEATLQRKLDRTCHDISNYLAAADARLATAIACTTDSRMGAQLGAAAHAIKGARDTAASARSDYRAEDRSHPVDLVPLVRRAASLLASEQKPAGAVRLECQVASVSCDVDALVFMRALTNLLHNAFEAGGDQDVVVSVAPQPAPFPADAYAWRSGEGPTGRRIVVSVRDHGCGISRENVSQIFNAYFSTKTGKAVATRGLGLDAVMELVARARGAVQVSSAPGFGSQFDILLPAVEIIDGLAPKPPSTTRQVKSVALVDDDPAWLDALSAAFRKHPIEVASFDSARAVIDSISRGGAGSDAIVIDRFLGPNGDGLALGGLIRRRFPGSLIVCLSSAPPDAALAADFDFVVDKSIGADAAVARIVGRESDQPA